MDLLGPPFSLLLVCHWICILICSFRYHFQIPKRLFLSFRSEIITFVLVKLFLFFSVLLQQHVQQLFPELSLNEQISTVTLSSGLFYCSLSSSFSNAYDNYYRNYEP